VKKLFIGGLLLAGIVAFAGTCTLQHYQLTTIGTHDTYAGEIHNDTGANFLQHRVVVAFVDPDGAVVDTQTVTPCLRTLPNGAATFFSAQSTEPAANTSIGLAKLELGSSLKVGTAATGSGTITGLTVNRTGTTLAVNGTFKNTDSSTLTEPNACAVVYSSNGKVLAVKLDQTMSDLAPSASDTFSISMTVLDSTTSVNHVDVYVDGLQDGVPILPIKDLNNSVTVGGIGTKLAFTTQPGGSACSALGTTTCTGGTAWGTSPVVTVQNADGTTATGSNATVTLAITTGTGSPSAALSCTGGTSEVAVNGIATFTGCSINLASGAPYTLTATASGLTSATSATFWIKVGAAAKVGFVVQPSGGTADGTAWVSQPQVAVQDAGGNTVAGGGVNVTLSITGAPAGVTLACTSLTVATEASGIAPFAGCTIDKAGTYTLKAISGSLTYGTSSSFTVVPKLVFTTQPGGGASGAVWATQPVVTLQNADGSPVTSSTATVTLTASGGTLACTTNPVTAVAGVATFAGCKITGAAGLYHLIANDSVGSTAVNSADFTIS